MLRCDVCGKIKEENEINVHSAINMPISLGYCADCDKKGYITLLELLKYMSKPTNKERIIKNLDVIIENCNVLFNAFLNNERPEVDENE